MNAELGIGISSYPRTAVVGLPSAVLEGELDGVGGLCCFDHQLAHQHEEVSSVDVVAELLVDGLVDREDGRGLLDQAGAAVCVADAAVRSH